MDSPNNKLVEILDPYTGLLDKEDRVKNPNS
jgi:hypothetical protein